MIKNKSGLPSADSANDFIDGKPGALQRVVLHALGRAAIIYAGMQAARVLKVDVPKNALTLSLFASAAIEAFVIIYLKNENKKQETTTNEVSQWSI